MPPNEQLPLSDLVAAFLDRTLPKAAWTHHAHLRTGLWHVLRYGEADALDRLRVAIAGYNESVGGQNTDTAGYHETVTRFYVRVIAAFVARCDRSRPVEELAEELLAEAGDKELPLRYYSRGRLFSVAARRGWVEPDLLPLP